MMTGQEVARAFDDINAAMDLVTATVDTDPVTALAYMRALEPTLERLAEHAPGQAAAAQRERTAEIRRILAETERRLEALIERH